MLISIVSLVLILGHFLLLKRKNRVKGFVKPGFESVLSCYQHNFNTELDYGSAFAAFYKGELVVSAYGGLADSNSGKLWQKDTCTRIFSCTKAIGALCLAQLADRGLLDYKKPVSAYWPEFAVNGKKDITVETLLSHQAGLWASDEPIRADDILTKPDKVSRILAEQKPMATPGSRTEYHALIIGPYMDELMKRIDPKHRTIQKYFEDEIATPFNLDIGIIRREDQKDRRATIYKNWGLLLRLFDPKYYNTLKLVFQNTWLNTTIQQGLKSMPDILKRGDVPNVSLSGVATAESLAKLYSLVLEGKIISRKMIQLLSEPITDMSEFSSHKQLTFSLGLSPIPSHWNSWMIGSPGLGGQMSYCDPTNDVSFAFLTNHMSPMSVGDDPRHVALQEVLYTCIEKQMTEKQT